MARRDSYPNQAGFKAEGTSRDAADSVDAGTLAADSVDAGTLRLAVLVVLQSHGPMTPDECAEKLGLSVLSVRPRFTELKAAGRIIYAGDRRKNRSGRYAEVCSAIPAIPNYQRGLATLQEVLAQRGTDCGPIKPLKRKGRFDGMLSGGR